MRINRSEVRRNLWVALPLVGVVFLLPRLIAWAQISLTFVAWPWQFDQAEGVNLDATVQLAQGHNIYAPNGPDAFISAPYTPLFYVINVPFTWITGPSFGVGRAISMLATLAIGLLLFYMVWKVTGAWSAGVLAWALWLAISPVIVWSALYTQNMLALALGFGGLVWTLRYSGAGFVSGPPGGRQATCVGALLFALAFYTKQTALDAAIATTLWLLAVDLRKGLRFALALFGLVALPFAIANLLSEGGLWEKVIANHPLAWNDKRALRLINRLWGEYWPLIAWAIGAFIGILLALWNVARVRRSPTAIREAVSSAWALAALYALISTALVVARIGNDGINYNHLLDMMIPFCLLAGLSVGSVLRRLETHTRIVEARPGGEGSEKDKSKRGRIAAALLAVGVSAVLLAAQLLWYRDPHTWYIGAWPEGPRDAQMRSLSNLVATTPGDILSDDSYLLLSNGRRVLFDDSFMFATLASAGKWDDSVLVKSLRDRRFPLLMLFDTDRWPPEQQEALQDDYRLKFLDELATYVPRLVPDNPQYSLQCTLAGNGDTLALKGYSLAPGVAWNGIGRGEVLRASLYWQAGGKIGQDYASYVHMVDDRGEKVAAQDNPQTGAGKPTRAWSAGSVITDTASLPVPADVAPGRYRLVGGMYRFDQGTGKIETLPASCPADEQYGAAVALGWVDVK